jgi:hypothetical protein
MNAESLERANAFLAAVSARTPEGEVMSLTPAEVGREVGLPDPLSAARAVRALIARRRLEPAQGSYRLVSARPVDPDEKEAIERPPRKRRGPAASGGKTAVHSEPGRATYSELGREAVEKLIELGRETSTLRTSLKAAREEAREARESRIEAEHRADSLAARVRDLEARAEMAESNLRALLATAKGAGRGLRERAVDDTEMEAILGVLKGGENPAAADG